MSYAFAAHVAELLCANTGAEGHHSARPGSFALVDVAQLRGLRKPLPELVPDAAVAPLFEAGAAGPASGPTSGLPPLLFALADTPARWRHQVLALDAQCRPWPAMSLLLSRLPLQALRDHLHALQHVEAESTACLLRLADTQMLAAVNAVFTPGQRAHFFQGIEAWWSVDHDGQLCDAADSRHHPRTPGPSGLPLRLDTAQTHALLDATAVASMASRVRHLEASFDDALSHAQQTGFISNCLATARDAGVRDDTGLVMWTLQRWQAEQARRA